MESGLRSQWGMGKGGVLRGRRIPTISCFLFLLMGILLVILPVMELVVLSAVEVSFPPDYLLFYAGLPFLLGGNESLSGAVGAAQAVAESGSSGNRAGKNISPVGADHAGIAGAYRRRKSTYL